MIRCAGKVRTEKKTLHHQTKWEMKNKTVYCEECVEEIPGDEVYWEDEHLYCRRCGSELEIDRETANLLDTFEGGGAQPLYSHEDEEFDEQDEEGELTPDEEKD